MNYVSYLIFRSFVFIFWLSPFFLLYFISNTAAFLFFYILPYRKKIVLQNLRQSFPKKSEKELKQIAFKFYKNLVDILLESLKGFSLSKNELMRRYQFKNLDVMNRFYDDGKSVIALASHFSNWEWGALSGDLYTKHSCIGFYKPLSNVITDRYVRKIRAHWGMTLASIYETSITFDKFHDKKTAFLMVADQSPKDTKQVFWTNFLGQKTAFLMGPEKHARRLNLPLVFLDINRIKRGFYEVNIVPLCDDISAEKEFAVTEDYVRLLEKQILKKPEDWLWSHKRWKLKK